METEPRKATDVLLDLESKIEILLQIIRSQDLNIKLLSNKLNLVIEKLEKQPISSSKIMVEAVNTLTSPITNAAPEPEKNITISSDFNIVSDSSPQGFRRTSRPETFAGDNVYLKSGDESVTRFPMQIPKSPTNKASNKAAEVVVPNSSPSENKTANNSENTKSSQNGIPTVQRVVDKNGKSIFLAEVEILNSSNNESVFKTRTNGTGKWMASLPIGSYRVIIRKRESVSKEKLEAGQTIVIDGSQSPLELQTIIIK